MPRDVPPGAGEPDGRLPPAAKTKEEFAARIRELRTQAGSPSFRHLAKVTNYSPSTLADATYGRRLPTEPVLRALVTACGADPAPWLEELRGIASAGPADSQAEAAADTAMDAGATGRRSLTVRWLWAGLAAGTVLVFGAGVALGQTMAGGSSVRRSPAAGSPVRGDLPSLWGTPSPAPTTRRVQDGTDPNVGHCRADARLVDKAPVMRGATQIGALELKYSAWCGAGWAMIYLYPGEPIMMGQVTVRAGDGRAASFTNPLVKQVDDYTDVIVPGPAGCLGARGEIYQAGEPIMAATIPCQVMPGRS
ncbi:MAG TPA: helix-turn-helix domain-containing protein [Streptosporangiaceae bacterium]